ELHCINSRQHLWTTRRTAESDLLFRRRASNFRPAKPQVPRDAIQALLTRRTLDVLHQLAIAIEDLNLQSRLLVELVFQVVSDQRTRRRIRTSENFVANAVTRKATRKPQRLAHRKQMRVAAENLWRHLLNRSRVVEDPDTAPVRGENQIVFTRMHDDVV